MTILATVFFTILAAGSGLIVAAMLRADRRQTETLAIEFACRNNAIIALIGLVVLDRPDLAAFGLVVFLPQVPFVLGGIVLARTRRRWF